MSLHSCFLPRPGRQTYRWRDVYNGYPSKSNVLPSILPAFIFMNRSYNPLRQPASYVRPVVISMGSSTVSDVHFGHFSHALHPGIESATTFSCHTL